MRLYTRPTTSPCMIQVSFQRLFTCCEKVWEVFGLMSIICDESTPVNLNCTVYSLLFGHLDIELPANLKSDRTNLWYTNKTISTTLNVLSSYIYVTKLINYVYTSARAKGNWPKWKYNIQKKARDDFVETLGREGVWIVFLPQVLAKPSGDETKWCWIRGSLLYSIEKINLLSMHIMSTSIPAVVEQA